MAEESGFKLGEGTSETLKSVAAAIINDFVPEASRLDEEKILSLYEQFLEGLPSLYRMGLVWILRAMEMAPLALGYRRQFSNLSCEDRVKVLDSFEKSSNYLQRGLIMALKSTLLITYFSEPELEKALGYDHHCLLSARGSGEAKRG